jgi:hypothetical protein
MLNRLKTHTPAWCIAFAFILTAAIARLVSFLDPSLHLELGTGRHIHHYVVGIFILTLAGYFALIFKGPRATFWIGLLYGFGVGLTFDEFGMWLSPRVDLRTRWSSQGLGLIIAGLILCTLIPILRRQASAPSSALIDEPSEPVSGAVFSED